MRDIGLALRRLLHLYSTPEERLDAASTLGALTPAELLNAYESQYWINLPEPIRLLLRKSTTTDETKGLPGLLPVDIRAVFNRAFDSYHIADSEVAQLPFTERLRRIAEARTFDPSVEGAVPEARALFATTWFAITLVENRHIGGATLAGFVRAASQLSHWPGLVPFYCTRLLGLLDEFPQYADWLADVDSWATSVAGEARTLGGDGGTAFMKRFRAQAAAYILATHAPENAPDRVLAAGYLHATLVGFSQVGLRDFTLALELCDNDADQAAAHLLRASSAGNSLGEQALRGIVQIISSDLLCDTIGPGLAGFVSEMYEEHIAVFDRPGLYSWDSAGA